MLTQPLPETVREWNPFAGEWITRQIAVPVMPAARPARTTRTRQAGRRHGAPVDRTGLSDGSPLPAYMCDTAFAPGEPLADMRTWIKPPAMKTGRAPVVMPACDAGAITETSRRR